MILQFLVQVTNQIDPNNKSNQVKANQTTPNHKSSHGGYKSSQVMKIVTRITNQVNHNSGVYKGKKRANVDDKKIPVGSRQG